MLDAKPFTLGDRFVFVLHQLEVDSVIVWAIIYFEIKLKKNEHLAIVTLFYQVSFWLVRSGLCKVKPKIFQNFIHLVTIKITWTQFINRRVWANTSRVVSTP